MFGYRLPELCILQSQFTLPKGLPCSKPNFCQLRSWP